MLTDRAYLLFGIIIFIVAIGGLSYAQYTQQKEINSLIQPAPITVIKRTVITPTTIPTASPTATLKYVPVTRVGTAAKATNIPTKGVVK